MHVTAGLAPVPAARRLALKLPMILPMLAATTALVAPAQLAAQEGDAMLLPTVSVETGGDDTDIVATEYASGSKMTTDVLDSAASVSVVTSKEFETRGAQDFEDIVAYTAGVVADEWGGGDDRYDGFRIRGFDGLSLGTYRDGLPVRGFGWTFGRREPYAFERVEVLKGSNSALFGLNAPGGLINAVSKTPKPYRFGEAYTRLGADHTELGVDFGDVLNAEGTLSYRVTAKVQEAERSYDYSQDDRRYLGLGLTWAPDATTSLTLLADYSKREGTPGNGFPAGANVDPETFLGEPGFNTLDTEEFSLGWQFRHDFGGGVEFRQTARYTYMDMLYEQVYGAGLTPSTDRTLFFVDSTSEQFAVDNQLQVDHRLGGAEGRLLLGYEFSRINVDEFALTGSAPGIDITNPVYTGPDSLTFIPYTDWEPEQTTNSLYLQEELTFADRWIVTFGGRYDMVDVDVFYPGTGTSSASYDSFTKRAGVTYKATPSLSVYGNYSESFEPSIWAIADAPTEGQQFEVGVKYRPEGTRALFTASVFDLTRTNVSTLVAPATYAQIGQVGVQGLELEAKAELASGLNLTAAYAYWDAKIEENGTAGNEGNRPYFTPEHMASLWLDYTIPGAGTRGDITVGGGVRYVGSSYSDDANTSLSPSRTTFDLAATYALSDEAEVALNVSNVFDKRSLTANYYGTEYYTQGREIAATLRYRW